MTSTSRRALPWMISLGAHLAAVAALALILAAPLPAVRVARVDLSLAGDGPGGSSSARSASRPRDGSGTPRTAAVAAPASARASPAADSAATAAPAQDAAAVRTARPEPPVGSIGGPAASDVLADVASVSTGPGAAPATNDTGGLGAGNQWGWQGLPRTLIRKRAPEFPVVLSAMGQEIEGEARISVAPSGIVTRVEITRSSGYIEIDASVQAALRDYLFSRVGGRDDSVGTVEFRFRLEKQD